MSRYLLAVASPEFCSGGRHRRVAHGFRSLWWQSHSEVKAIWRWVCKNEYGWSFFATACHSNWWLWRSNFELTELGRKISPAIVWTAAKFACIRKLQGGGTCPSATCLTTPLSACFSLIIHKARRHVLMKALSGVPVTDWYISLHAALQFVHWCDTISRIIRRQWSDWCQFHASNRSFN